MENRRDYLRINCMLSCQITFSEGKIEDVFILDISEGRMFVQYDHPIKINSKLHFSIFNRDKKELLLGNGIIVWHTDQLFEDQKQGFGVLFSELGGPLKENIDILVEKLNCF